MCSVAPITAALSTVHDPVPPEGASESDKSRLFELCDLRHCHQKGKDSLQLRGKMANLGNKVKSFVPQVCQQSFSLHTASRDRQDPEAAEEQGVLDSVHSVVRGTRVRSACRLVHGSTCRCV